jgi:hypothetical protein
MSEELKPGREANGTDRWMARICRACPLCRRARAKQRGLAYAWVKRVETSVCPFCRAYERVYGRKAHEAIPGGPQ